MPIASRLSQYISRKGVICQPLHHARSHSLDEAVVYAEVVPELCLRAIPLIDRQGPAIAVIPFPAELDLEPLNRTLGRQFQALPEQQAGKLFQDCDPGVIPPFAMAYGLPVLVDADVLEQDHAFAASGSASMMLKITGHALKSVMKGAIKVRMSRWPKDASKQRQGHESREMTLDGVARKLQSIYKLPPMPETAVRIMHLTADPDSDVFELAQVVERDPSLSAQVMRYARSALFNYRGELTCIQEAINRVLGFDRVSQLAMGIAAAKAFNIPSQGPLGLTRFWQHALYAGVLSQALALLADPDLELNERDAYLAGLLHNFGILLIGHLFPPEFQMLNKLRESEPEVSMAQIEQQVFGVGSAQDFIGLGHGSMGAILLKLWGLPESTIKAAAMHQKSAYQGSCQHYVEIVQLANYFLADFGIGDEPAEIDPAPLLTSLGIDQEKAITLAEKTVEQCRSLDVMADNMAA